MKNKKISMQMIADQLGISKVTVYKALNNKPYVSKDLNEQILQIAAELGYNKNNLKNKIDINTLAFVVPRRFFLEQENFYTTIFYYLNKMSLKQNINLTLFVINRNDEENIILPSTLISNSFDGIFIGGEITNNYIKAIANIKAPIILIDFYKPEFNFDCVITDNFYNGINATNHLIEKGHKEIGFLGDFNQTSSISDRFFGYQKALSTHNLTYNSNWHLVNNNTETGVYTLDISLPESLPTAFVCHCDMAAYFLIQRLNMSNIKVPKDVSIISFDNTKLCESSIPKLTSIDINTKKIAQKAFEQLIERIKFPNSPQQRLYITCDIIERDSETKKSTLAT